MRFGMYLPTYAWPDLTFDQTARIKEFARKAEHLGFDALWVIEHFLVAPSIYGTPWMSPLLCLANVAAVTTRIRLATGLLILPYYHPVTLAREIQTLHHLSEGRFVLGVAPGFEPTEFGALDLPVGERGGRTDEILRALRRLLTERDVTFEGRYYRFEHVTIEPLLPAFPELWVGGGSKVESPLSPDRARMHPGVLRRIAAGDGWLTRAAANGRMLEDDLRTVRAYLRAQGRAPDSLQYGHVNFFHLVDTSDREKALSVQLPRLQKVMGSHRSAEDLAESYFLGTTAEIVERIRRLEASGISYLLVGTLDDDLEQLERFADEVVPRFEY